MERARRRSRGLVGFVAFTFVLAWIPAWLLHDLWPPAGRPLVTQLLTCSLYYALCMGWQPLVAVALVTRWIDPSEHGRYRLQRVSRRFLVVGVVGPLLLVALSMAVGWFGSLLVPLGDSVQGYPEGHLALLEPSVLNALLLASALLAALGLLGAQAFFEELGWRGYFLAGIMRQLGPWRGLAAHGLVWGLWYAPILLFGTDDLLTSVFKTAGFVLTCSLLGALLGWLRLSSRSILPSAIANGMLTLAAGLPYVLEGIDTGLRGAVYGPPGWLAMALVLLLLVYVRRCRVSPEA